MADDELREALLTGEAWDDFCETLKQAGQLILAPSVPRTDVDRAEGYRYLTRLLRMGLDQMLEHGNPDYPHLQKAAGPTRKIGIDNPDNDYFIARISGEHRYRLHGTRGTVGYIGVGIYAGSLAGGERRTIAHLNAGDLLPDADGNVNLVLSPDEPAGHEGHWIEIDPDTSTIMIRQTFLDRTTEKPARLRLERLDAEGPPPPLAADYITSSLTTVSRFVFGVAAFFAQMAEQWKVQPNRFWPSDSKVSRETFGDPDLYYMGGYWKLDDDEAMVIEFTPPECAYWGFVLCNYWMESLDYRYRPIETNAHRARKRGDGSVKIVVARSDPGLPDANWIDTEGHREGTMCLRWLLAKTTPVPEPRVLKAAELSEEQ